MGGQVGHLQVGDGAEPGDRGIVVDGQRAVGGEPHVELDAVGPQAPGLGEGVDGVLGEPLGATPMSEDVGHRSAVIWTSRIRRGSCAGYQACALPQRGQRFRRKLPVGRPA